MCGTACRQVGYSGWTRSVREHRQQDGLTQGESVRLWGRGPASKRSGRLGLLQRVLRQRILLASQRDLLRMAKKGLLSGLLRPTAQLLHRLLGQRVLFASQWDLLRMEREGLLSGLLCPTTQLLHRMSRQCFLFTSQWDLLRVEEQGLLRNMPALSKLRGHWEVTWHSACFGPLHDRFRLMQGWLLWNKAPQDHKDLRVGLFLMFLRAGPEVT